jgi:hypothetical protein
MVNMFAGSRHSCIVVVVTGMDPTCLGDGRVGDGFRDGAPGSRRACLMVESKMNEFCGPCRGRTKGMCMDSNLMCSS